MRRLALIASVLLGASTAAQAWPFTGDVHGKIIIRTDNDRDRYDRDYNHDHYRGGYQARRWDRARFHGRYDAPSYMMLGDNLNGSGRRQILQLDGQRLNRVIIQAEQGSPAVEMVAIDFGNGKDDKQIVNFNQRLGGRFGRDNLVVEVTDRRPVARVIVYTLPQYGGTFSVLAE